MLNPADKAKIAKELSLLFKTYVSSRTINPEAAIYYIEDCAEFSLEAVLTAIVDFRKNRVPDREGAFAPSVAEFVGHTRACQEAIDVREFWDKTDFLLVDSAEWKAICEAREVRSMPQVEYKGPVRALRGSFGWYVEKIEVARHADLIAEHRAELLRIEQRGPLRLGDAE